jgi:transcriptional repressor NrdR
MRFTSYERIEEKPFMVVKRDGRREPFDHAKIEAGLERAIEKRPVARMEVERLVNEIEDVTVTGAGDERECPTKMIGELILERLAELDKVAYIRFASVYRHYGNLDEFVKEIKKLGAKHDRKSRKTIT